MNLYIDTEFNEFNGALISMALIDEFGQYFYESLGCENPGPWVTEHVMPIIHKEPISREEMQSKLQDFLRAYSSIHIVADWPEDIKHFLELLITGPGLRINTPPLTMEIRGDLDGAESLLPHNALEDARAIRRKAMGITLKRLKGE